MKMGFHSISIVVLTILSFVSVKSANIANTTTAKPTIKETPKVPVNDFHFHLDPSWPHKSVSDLKYFGSGIAIAKDGNIIVLHRGIQDSSKPKVGMITENTLAVIDPKTGKILKEWGKDKFIKPHGIFISESGDLFITDTIMHQIFKFPFESSTKLWQNNASIIIGQRFGPALSVQEVNKFCAPSDLLEVPETGDFFVADGYCMSRVMKFDKMGKYVKQFGSGSLNNLLPPTPFNITHALALARRHPSPHPGVHQANFTETLNSMLLVADRNNARIQFFTLNGEFIYEIGPENFGPQRPMIFSMDTTHIEPLNNNSMHYEFGQLYVISGHLPTGQPKVFIFGLQSNNFSLISAFATSQPPSEVSSKHLKIESPHDIAVTKDGKEIYIVEATRDLVLKRFVKGDHTHPPKGKGTKGLANLVTPTGTFLIVLIIVFTQFI